MRITSNTITNLVQNGSQNSQQGIALLQQQISSGNVLQAASDDPNVYAQATATQNTISSLNGYSNAASQATTLTAQNNQAMTSLHKIVANAGELLAGVNGTSSPASLQNLGSQVDSLISQLKSIVNQSSNGNYLFGGTANQPPIAAGNTYNTATNGTETTIDVQQGNPVTTGIVAGRSGTPPVDGFLYNSASGTDVLASLQQASADLKAGNVSAVQTNDVPAVNKALDLISSYVGSTASDMAAVQTASDSIQQQLVSQETRMSNLTQTNLPNASVQLQQLQQQYQATLEAGTRVMNLSILNYLGAVTG